MTQAEVNKILFPVFNFVFSAVMAGACTLMLWLVGVSPWLNGLITGLWFMDIYHSFDRK